MAAPGAPAVQQAMIAWVLVQVSGRRSCNQWRECCLCGHLPSARLMWPISELRKKPCCGFQELSFDMLEMGLHGSVLGMDGKVNDDRGAGRNEGGRGGGGIHLQGKWTQKLWDMPQNLGQAVPRRTANPDLQTKTGK